MRRHRLCIDGTVCPHSLIWTFDNPIRRILHNPARIFGELVREGQTVIDIGCGLGYFTIPLARMVGPAGQVHAVDRQEAMLEGVRRRAERAGVADRVRLRLVDGEKAALEITADFILAFWMVHEVPDAVAFLRQLRGMLHNGGRLLLVEPRIHVNAKDFERTLRAAAQAGMRKTGEPRVAISRAALFEPA